MRFEPERNWRGRYLMSEAGEYVAVGSGGWLFWFLPDEPADIRVQVKDVKGRLQVTALFVEGFSTEAEQHVLKAKDLRALPIGRLEDFLNDAVVAKAIREDIDGRGYGADFHPGRLATEEAREVADSFELRIPPRVSLRLDGAKDSRHTEDFYRQVAAVWIVAGTTSRAPATDIARANKVNETAVHRWVREARRRGFLAPSRRAKKQE